MNNVFILNGSPKGKRSASNNIISFISSKFEDNGIITQNELIVKNINDEKLDNLINKMMNSDLIILVAPLYIDALPAIVVRLMEEYKTKILIESEINQLEKSNYPEKQKLMAVINSGFPEPDHNDFALSICENFAWECHMEWVGGVKIGMGAAFENRSLEDAGAMSKNLRQGLQMAIDAISNDNQVPLKSFKLTSKPLMPLFLSKFLMLWFGETMWSRRAKGNVSKRDMYARPYE